MSAYQTVVVGTDGSDSSLRAVDRAGAVAADHGAKLIVATAYFPAGFTCGSWGVPPGILPNPDPKGEGYQLSGNAPVYAILREAHLRAKAAGARDIEERPIVGDDRYAGGKAQIRDAVLMRLAARIIDTVRRAVAGLSGPERVVTAITVALDQIRSDPIRRLVLSSTAAPDLNDLHFSPVLGRLAAELTGITDDDPQAGQWIVRVVLSLAYWPIGNSRAERQMLRRFVSPAFGMRT